MPSPARWMPTPSCAKPAGPTKPTSWLSCRRKLRRSGRTSSARRSIGRLPWAPLNRTQLLRPEVVTPALLERTFARASQAVQSNSDKVHVLLAIKPLPQLGQVYQLVFEKILQEQVSTNPVAVADR